MQAQYSFESELVDDAIEINTQAGRLRIDHPDFGEMFTLWWGDSGFEILMHRDTQIRDADLDGTPHEGWVRATLDNGGPRYMRPYDKGGA